MPGLHGSHLWWMHLHGGFAVDSSQGALLQLFELLKEQAELLLKLEERIIALERAESVVHIHPTDSYYWEHG